MIIVFLFSFFCAFSVLAVCRKRVAAVEQPRAGHNRCGEEKGNATEDGAAIRAAAKITATKVRTARDGTAEDRAAKNGAVTDRVAIRAAKGRTADGRVVDGRVFVTAKGKAAKGGQDEVTAVDDVGTKVGEGQADVRVDAGRLVDSKVADGGAVIGRV